MPAVLWLAGEVVLWPQGGLNGQAGSALLGTLEALLLCGLTAWLTKDQAPLRRPVKGRWLGVQMAAVALCYAGILMTGVSFNLGVAAGWNLLGALHDVVSAAVLPLVGRDAFANGIGNVVEYLLPAMLVLAALGVPLKEIGFGAFLKRSGVVAIVWLIAPLAYFAVALLTHKMQFGWMLLVWLANILQNGFPEEVFFRGILMGRLRTMLMPDATLVVQALLFGFWHLGYALHLTHGNVETAIATMIVSQSVFGLAAGYVAQRTGNVAVPTAFHFLADAGAGMY